ncbi:MAG: preprotein translocase subunit SecE [Clostridia bacterium]
MPEAKVKKPNVFSNALKATSKFIRDCKGELKRIVWPTKQAVLKNMGVVLITVLIATICIFALDSVFMNLLGLVMDVAN